MLYSRGKGHYDKEYGKLWRDLVPRRGQANTVQGELVRAIARLAVESYKNGNLNWNGSFRQLVTFLRKHLTDESVFDAPTIAQIKRDLADIGAVGNGSQGYDYPKGEDPYDRVTDRVVEWCQKNPKPIRLKKNPKLKV